MLLIGAIMVTTAATKLWSPDASARALSASAGLSTPLARYAILVFALLQVLSVVLLILSAKPQAAMLSLGLSAAAIVQNVAAPSSTGCGCFGGVVTVPTWLSLALAGLIYFCSILVLGLRSQRQLKPRKIAPAILSVIFVITAATGFTRLNRHVQADKCVQVGNCTSAVTCTQNTVSGSYSCPYPGGPTVNYNAGSFYKIDPTVLQQCLHIGFDCTNTRFAVCWYYRLYAGTDPSCSGASQSIGCNSGNWCNPSTDP